MINKIKTHVNQLAKDLVVLCREKGMKISFAESMTGGLLVSQITRIENASKILEESFVVYSNQAKMRILSCKEETIKKHSVYSKEVVSEMIQGLNHFSQAHIKVSVSGIAGPKTYGDFKVGQVFIGIEINNELFTFKQHFNGDREEIQWKTTEFIFEYILSQLEGRESL